MLTKFIHIDKTRSAGLQFSSNLLFIIISLIYLPEHFSYVISRFTKTIIIICSDIIVFILIIFSFIFIFCLDIKNIVRKNRVQFIAQRSEPKEAESSTLWQLLCAVVNSLPIILMVYFSFCILHTDYVARNSNFWGKHTHWGMIYPHDVYEEVKCADKDYVEDRKKFPQCAPKHCGRFFNDFVFSEGDADALLK